MWSEDSFAESSSILPPLPELQGLNSGNKFVFQVPLAARHLYNRYPFVILTGT